MTQLGKYILKKPAITDKRIQRIAKKIIDESFADRKKALEAYDFFLGELKGAGGQPLVFDAVKGLTDSLRLAQSSFTNVMKLVEIMVRLNLIMKTGETGDLAEKGKYKTIFSQLDSLVSLDDKDT